MTLPPPTETEHPICELALCEATKLALKPDQPYIFRVFPGCTDCQEAARLAFEGAPEPL